jgi:phage-related protein
VKKLAETIKGINIKLSLDGKDLDNELSNINKDLKEQQKDLKAINTNLRYDSSNVELWRKKQSQLNEMLQTTKKRLDTQNQALEKAKQGLKLGTVSEAEFRKVQRNVSYSESEVKRLNNELEKTKDKIKSLGNIKFDNLVKVGSTLTKSITMPILGAVTALTAFAKQGVNTADTLGNTAKQLGLSVEALQEWNHVAKISGSETQSLEKAFIKVNSMLGDIALGDVKSFAGVFHALGISMDEMKGKTTDEAFQIIRDALANVEDQSLKVALANHLFGDKIGSELLPMLNLEKEAITGLRKEAVELGIITSEQAETTGMFKDSIDRLKQSVSALSVEVALVMLPAMQAVVDMIQNKVIPASRNIIEWWNGLSDSTQKLITFLIGLAAAIGPILVIIGKVGPLIKGLVIGIKAVGAAGIFAGIGLNAATLGIGALIAIVVMALLESEKFKELLGKLMETFMRLLEPIMQIVEVLMNALKPILDIVINIFIKLIDILVPIIDIILVPLIKQVEFLGKIFELLAPLIEIVGNVLQAILVPAFQVLEKILNPILKILEKIIGFFEDVFNFAGKVGDVVGNALGGVGDAIGGVVSGIGDFVGGVANKVTGFASGVVNQVSGFIGDTVDKVTGFANDSVKGIADVSKNIVDGVSNFANQAKDKVGGFFGKVGGLFNNSLNLKKESKANQSVTSNQATTTNSITINTSSSSFDIDSINRALGGKYI